MDFDKGLIGGSTILLILSLIDKKDRYGFEIIKELEILSDKAFQFKEGTLYPVLHKLEKNGYLKSYKIEGDRGRARKYYKITENGKKQLIDERTQWTLFSSSVEKVIGGELDESN